MKLAILGGGGFRVPFIHQALLRGSASLRVDEVVLHDSDPDRLTAMVQVLDQLSAGSVRRPRLRATTALDDALADADFVFAAIRVGGVAARVQDERVALELGVLGQETTGPGGLAYGLRTIPVMVGMARRIAELAPRAYVLNFTNPAGMITEAMQAVLGDRVLGICDTPSDLGRRLAAAVGVDAGRLQLDYVGLNHLGWMRRVLHDGEDLLPTLLADDTRLAGLEEAEVFGPAWLRSLGAVPNEYLYYYYRNREAVRAILDSASTRGEYLAAQQNGLFRQLLAEPARAADLWRAAVAERDASYMAEARGHAAGAPDAGAAEAPAAHAPLDEDDLAEHGYAGVALRVMAAISQDRGATMILNVRNGSTIPGLPEDAVVEVPAVVDATGVHPLATPPPDLHQLGLMQQVKAVERATIRAALSGSRDQAVLAFGLHPLVGSLDLAERLVRGYAERIPEVAAVLRS